MINLKETSNPIVVQNNQKIDDIINEVIVRFVENVARLYGVDVNIEDTDWQVIYDLKEHLYEALERIGMDIRRLI